MPACITCPRLAECRDNPPKTPIRACVREVLEQTVAKIQPGQEVLEVGCGVRKTPRKRVRAVGGVWSGVDAVWRNPILPGAFAGTASHLPFADNSFDWVLAFETMEHWEEFGESISDGLTEILRVLKSGGRFVATVPINFHGSDIFVNGDLQAIANHFCGHGWESARFEHWRREPFPLHDWYGKMTKLPVWTLEINGVKA